MAGTHVTEQSQKAEKMYILVQNVHKNMLCKQRVKERQ